MGIELIVVGFGLFIIGGFIWLGYRITEKALDEYDYNIWNGLAISLMVIMFLSIPVLAAFEVTEIIWVQIIWGSAIGLMWMKHCSKTSFFIGTVSTIWQVATCCIALVILLMALTGGTGSVSKKES